MVYRKEGHITENTRCRLPDGEMTSEFSFVLSPIPNVLVSPDSSGFLPLVDDEFLELETDESVRLRPPRLARASEIRLPAPLLLALLVTELDGCDVDSRLNLVTGDLGRGEDVRPLSIDMSTDAFTTEGKLCGYTGTFGFDITHRARESDVSSAQPSSLPLACLLATVHRRGAL